MSNEAAVGANMLLGKGEVYFDRFTSPGGASTGERFLGNVESLEIQITDELKQKYSSVQAAAPLAAEALTRRTPEVTLTLDEFTKDNLALALMGTTAAYTQLGTAVTAEAAVVPTLGNYFKLANRKVNTVVVKKGATTYVLGTDYTLDLETGRVKPLATGTMVAGDAITVDYARTAITAADQVAIGAQGQILGMLRFVPDPTQGPSWDIELWRVNMSPDGTLAFIGDDFGSYQLKGKILDDSAVAAHATTPLGRMIRRV